MNPASILPGELSISASFAPKKDSTSKLRHLSSKDVLCKWTTKTNDGATVLQSGSSTSLECERKNINKPSYVSIYEENSGSGNRLTIAWPAYTENGIPVNLVNELQRKMDDAVAKLDAVNKSNTGSVVAFNLSSCPAGWEEYAPAFGRFIRGIDKSGSKTDPSGPRDPGALQDDQFKKHSHEISLQGASGNNAFVNRSPAWSYDDWHGATSTTNSKEVGADETRPKNVSLLYCVKR